MIFGGRALLQITRLAAFFFHRSLTLQFSYPPVRKENVYVKPPEWPQMAGKYKYWDVAWSTSRIPDSGSWGPLRKCGRFGGFLCGSCQSNLPSAIGKRVTVNPKFWPFKSSPGTISLRFRDGCMPFPSDRGLMFSRFIRRYTLDSVCCAQSYAL